MELFPFYFIENTFFSVLTKYIIAYAYHEVVEMNNYPLYCNYL